MSNIHQCTALTVVFMAKCKSVTMQILLDKGSPVAYRWDADNEVHVDLGFTSLTLMPEAQLLPNY